MAKKNKLRTARQAAGSPSAKPESDDRLFHLLSARPKAELDETHRKRLKNTLLARFDQLRPRVRHKTAWRLFGLPGRMAGALSGALAFLVIAGVTVYVNRESFLPVRAALRDASQTAVPRRESGGKFRAPAPKALDRDSAKPEASGSMPAPAPVPEKSKTADNFAAGGNRAGQMESDTPVRSEDELSDQAFSRNDLSGTQAGRPPAAGLAEETAREKKTDSRSMALSLAPSLIEQGSRYEAIEKALVSGKAPSGAVRPLEWVNYFRYDLPDPAGGELFSVRLETSRCLWDTNVLLLMISLGAQDSGGSKPAVLAGNPGISAVFLPGAVVRAGLIGSEDDLAVRHSVQTGNLSQAVLQEGDQVVLLYMMELAPGFGSSSRIGSVTVDYLDAATGREQAREFPLTASVRRNPSSDFVFASAVAGWALRKNGQIPDSRLGGPDLIRMLERSAGQDPARIRFLEMVRKNPR